MNIVLLGPPGAGKGTQASKLINEFPLTHVATGDLFREAIAKKTELGLKAKSYIEKGSLVPDELTINLVKNKVGAKSGNFLFDGFPRTYAQALKLDELMKSVGNKINHVVYLDITEDVVIERITGRLFCSKCGENYHIKFKPPKKENVCDKCMSQVSIRVDDEIETIKKRLNEYNAKTKELVLYYEKINLLRKINGAGTPDEIYKRITKVLKNTK